MALSKANLVVAALVVTLAVILPANAQTQLSPCTASMLTSFTPCMNFLSNSTTNMTTPTPGCCSSLKSLATNGTGCLCQILTGAAPFRMPINRTSAISLPKSCNMAGVPLQCNLATGAPASAPGPSSAALSPTTATSPSPSTSVIPTVSSPSPISDTTPTATSPTDSTETPPTSSVSPGKTSNTAASAAQSSLAFSPSLLLVPFALVMIKYY